ncbi:hypothetical protein [Caldinitratiruptor microaerophilus]|uniref:Uncharacterized protein n=1 Tax=Caldinitratiruptor microaerophilus TaxID=671077 RepID=A0AA35CIH9_9FIRM|nr:hypothetical protein [Caldinitratiruptor microaerophilus]BDG59775.1 hypothetical protein caldi_08650 [Caldinitratiruptor microaerophilus]
MRRLLVRVLAAFPLLVAALAGASAAWAAAPPVVQGAARLVNEATSWLLLLVPGTGGSMLAYHALMRNVDPDETNVQRHNSAMRKVLIGTAIAETAAGTINWLSGYFQ